MFWWNKGEARLSAPETYKRCLKNKLQLSSMVTWHSDLANHKRMFSSCRYQTACFQRSRSFKIPSSFRKYSLPTAATTSRSCRPRGHHVYSPFFKSPLPGSNDAQSSKERSRMSDPWRDLFGHEMAACLARHRSSRSGQFSSAGLRRLSMAEI
jgi:hypothetical protein